MVSVCVIGPARYSLLPAGLKPDTSTCSDSELYLTDRAKLERSTALISTWSLRATRLGILLCLPFLLRLDDLHAFVLERPLFLIRRHVCFELVARLVARVGEVAGHLVFGHANTLTLHSVP